MITRLVHDVASRMVYPFLPEIATGLGLPIEQAGALISLRYGIGILGPVFGALFDRIGHRRGTTVGLIVLGFGMLVTGAASSLPLAAIGFILSGIGSVIFIPTLIAYVSDRVPYARRGRITGAIETTWAIAGMIGVPLIGVIIAAQGWRAPFFILGFAALFGAGLTLFLEESRAMMRASIPTFNVQSLSQHKSAIVFIVVWFLIFFAFENIQVGYSSWLETQYGLNTTERGSAQTFFGLFEIVASAGSTLFLDRIGKKRGVTGGLIVVMIGYMLLATLGSAGLGWALLSIGVAFLGFEFTVVSGIPIMGEQIPEARGTMIALTFMAGNVGRMAGDLAGSALTAGVGFRIAALISLIAAIVDVVAFAAWVHEASDEGRPQRGVAQEATGSEQTAS